MKFFRLIFDFCRDLWQNRYVIHQLTKRDYQNRYIGSTFGFIWTIIQPIVMIFVLWYVFTKGFKAGPIDGHIPFIAYMSVGMIAWDFFAQGITGSTNVFQEYSYLVKKINFRIAILPVIKILSLLVNHFIFMAIVMIILWISGIPFSLYWFQLFYYLVAVIVLLLGLSWITSSLQVFFKDISQIVNIVLTFGFWITPVIWDFNMVPSAYQWIFKLNPIFYIVDGYRRSLIYGTPFWQDFQATAYFWVFTIAIGLIGVFLFKKLRPHFADVL